MSSFLRAAKIIGLLTLASRVLGLLREMVSAHFLGTGLVASAFTVAFTIPNLFRKLFGEGALSAAFIPLYAKAVKESEEKKVSEEKAGRNDCPTAEAEDIRATRPDSSLSYEHATAASPAEFAAASVNLLV